VNSDRSIRETSTLVNEMRRTSKNKQESHCRAHNGSSWKGRREERNIKRENAETLFSHPSNQH
jgi:hypothetical protein